MKKVYLVYKYDGEKDLVLDVYTSQEEANKYVDYWNANTEYPTLFWTVESRLLEKSIFSLED